MTNENQYAVIIYKLDAPHSFNMKKKMQAMKESKMNDSSETNTKFLYADKHYSRLVFFLQRFFFVF